MIISCQDRIHLPNNFVDGSCRLIFCIELEWTWSTFKSQMRKRQKRCLGRDCFTGARPMWRARLESESELRWLRWVWSVSGKPIRGTGKETMIHSIISEGTCAVSQQKRKSLWYKRKEQEYERSEFSMMDQHFMKERSDWIKCLTNQINIKGTKWLQILIQTWWGWTKWILGVNRLGTLTKKERSDWIVKDAWQTFSNSRLMNEVSRLRNDIEAEWNEDLLAERWSKIRFFEKKDSQYRSVSDFRRIILL
jgi:hypothetical protein